jgi:hypothetical protein
MMICKGWYTNREEISKRQAVENYIREYLEMEPYGDCVIDILYKAVEKFRESNTIGKYLVEQSQKSNGKLPAIDFMIESLIHLLAFKVTLKMDLSDYKAIQDYVYGKDGGVIIDFENMSVVTPDNRPWWVRFKNDEVEDDLWN